MSWRNSVRKQINKAKSRSAENKITERIYRNNIKYNEEHADEIHQLGRSLSY